MKIAIVNDSPLALTIIQNVVSCVPSYDIIWTASDGAEAIQKAIYNTPDIILMDLIMPVINGVDATAKIMQIAPCAIIIVTASINSNSSMVYEAMGQGAIDVVRTPEASTINGLILLEKIKSVSIIIHNTPLSLTKNSPFSSSIKPKIHGKESILLIGASTGGPQALVEIFSKLPSDFPLPIVTVQHVDQEFAPGLVSWIQQFTPLTVKIAQSNESPKPGHIYFAQTNDHIVYNTHGTLQYTPNPQDLIYRPSIDILFKSFANHYHDLGLALLLTGMGQDGADGLLHLHNKGWLTITQDKQSSIVYSMPKKAAQIGAATHALPLAEIPTFLLDHFYQKNIQNL